MYPYFLAYFVVGFITGLVTEESVDVLIWPFVWLIKIGTAVFERVLDLIGGDK